MAILPFKTQSNPDKQIQVIEDGCGNSIAVPRYGWITWEENELFAQYTLQASINDELSMDTYHSEVVALHLRCRFNLPAETPKSEILQLADGSPVPQPMVEALSKFFKSERLQWAEENKQEPSASTQKK